MSELTTLNSVIQSLDSVQLVNPNATFQKKIEKNKNFLEKSNKNQIIENSKNFPKMQSLTDTVSSLNLNVSNLNTVISEPFVPIQLGEIVLPTMPATQISQIPLELPPVITTKPIEAVPTRVTIKTPVIAVLENKSNYTREQLSAMKKPELEAILTKMGVKKSGNKPELVDRILSGGTVKTPIKTPITTVLPVTINNPVEVVSNIPIPLTVSAPIVVPSPVIAINPNGHRYTREELEAKGMKKENLQAILTSLGAKKKTGNKADLVNMILEIQQKS
jgi:hypothetical protein